MFKMLEKLINEHGSSNILKERLGLKDDQISALKEEFATLTKQNTDLQEENTKLKRKLDEADSQLRRFQENIAAIPREGERNLGIQERVILRLLFNKHSYLRIDEIANLVELDQNMAKYHVNNLVESGLVHDSLSSGSPTKYSINDEGIKFIAKDSNT
jgi:Fic family protein